MDDDGVRVIVLGGAQDGGLPQVGCRCANCVRAREEPERAEGPSSVAIVDDRSRRFWFLDMSWDFPRQYDWLADRLGGTHTFSGAVLTHAHIGHYLGLLQLGREVMGAHGVPVFGSPRLLDFLGQNGPFSQLMALGNITPRPLRAGLSAPLADGLAVSLVPVPHRGEWSDTMAVGVRGPRRSLLYLPDIDGWERWDRALWDVLGEVDLAFLDATFFDAGELPGRDRSEIPHPMVADTLSILSAGSAEHLSKLHLIHLNHSNPLWDPGFRERSLPPGVTVARRGVERSL